MSVFEPIIVICGKIWFSAFIWRKLPKHLKAMGMIQKQGNELKLKPRDVVRRFFHRKCPDMPPRWRPDRIFTVPRLCSAFGGNNLVWCIMSYWNRVKRSQGIGIERNYCVWAEHWRRNGHITKRYDKVILQHNNVRLHVARPVNWLLHHDNAPAHSSNLMQQFLSKHSMALLRQPPYSPDIAPWDFWLFLKLKKPLKRQRLDDKTTEIKGDQFRGIGFWIEIKQRKFKLIGQSFLFLCRTIHDIYFLKINPVKCWPQLRFNSSIRKHQFWMTRSRTSVGISQ